MPFSKPERETLLKVKGIGPKVIERLEQLGINSLDRLACEDAAALCAAASNLVGSTCWKNSPQARGAIERAITAAVEATEG
jgi:nucleotidyltransferase/DNA polymerase involved in DNA repair